eukprot:TRINITY_DN18719_c0_g2_i3.p2 TRINITY_DN18719_c0_g2~~TRINITY_DN18719_c0_g2_i3.p2  ORF type:complete len:173 (-),score=10.72 TRINITY_DN18719_c0_g2_i3:84-602(-)
MGTLVKNAILIVYNANHSPVLALNALLTNISITQMEDPNLNAKPIVSLSGLSKNTPQKNAKDVEPIVILAPIIPIATHVLPLIILMIFQPQLSIALSLAQTNIFLMQNSDVEDVLMDAINVVITLIKIALNAGVMTQDINCPQILMIYQNLLVLLIAQRNIIWKEMYAKNAF